jgi:hypothetical protein
MGPRTARTGAAVAAPGGTRSAATDRHWRGAAGCALGCALALTGLTTLLDWGAGTLTPPRALLWLGLGAALFAVLLPPRLTAGRGWLAARGLLRRRVVSTDALVAVRQYPGPSGELVLEDAHGRRLSLDPRVLAADPLLWHELDAGARTSVAEGTLGCGAEVLRELGGRIDGGIAYAVFRASGLS